MHVVPRALDIIDDVNLNQIDTLEQRCFYDHAHNISKAADTCSGIMDYIRHVSGYVLNYNTRLFDYDWDPIEAPYVNLLSNSPKKDLLYSALHVSESTKSPVFSPGSEDVALGYLDDNLVDYSSYYNYLLEEGYPYIVQAGEFDMQDGASSQSLWMRQLLKVSSNFWEQDRAIYYYNNDNETKVGGYYKSEGEFTYIAVPKSGHFFPHDNYWASKAILDDMIKNKELSCILEGDNCRVNEYMCQAMNQCNNHGSCGLNGQCICDFNFKGADCYYEALNNWSNISSVV